MPRGDDGQEDGQDDGFLTRWSRRKREVLAENEASKAGAGSATGSLPPAPQSRLLPTWADVAESRIDPTFSGEWLGMGGRAGCGSTSVSGDGLDSPPLPGPPQRKRGEGEEQPELEMIEPPSLDLIDKDFDVAHWLKQNVPESWKLAALRRAWESDPFIAGFENPARDYALEWNIPGGAPGYGPLTESDDVAAMLRSIFGDTPKPEPADPTLAEATGDSMPHQNVTYDESRNGNAASQQNTGGRPEPVSVRLTNDDASDLKSGGKAAVASDKIYAAAQNSAPSDPPAVRIRKRGGSAMPV